MTNDSEAILIVSRMMRDLESLINSDCTMEERARELASLHNAVEAAISDLDTQASDLGFSAKEMPFYNHPGLKKMIKRRQAEYRKRRREHTDV